MSLSVTFVNSILQACARTSIDGYRAMHDTGFDVERLADASGRVTIDEFDALVERLAAVTGDESMGLRVVERAGASSFEVIGPLVGNAVTLRAAFDAVMQFTLLLADAPESALTESEDRAIFRCGLPGLASSVGHRVLAEIAASGFQRLLRVFGGPEVRVKRVLFDYPAPAYRAEYARIFDGAETFDHAFVGIEFDRGLLDLPQLHRNDELYELLHSHAQRKLGRLLRSGRLTDRVAEHLVRMVPGGRPRMTQTARGLGMSVRSLRRRLKEEGISYKTLTEHALGAVASRLLDDPRRSVQEIAHAMGYATPSEFHRAFKRWTGVTPAAYRRDRDAPLAMATAGASLAGSR